ncbi:hypothetical protein M432DRAFT_476505 [Thermoascus aurantiacus ATCC 26904]
MCCRCSSQAALGDILSDLIFVPSLLRGACRTHPLFLLFFFLLCISELHLRRRFDALRSYRGSFVFKFLIGGFLGWIPTLTWQAFVRRFLFRCFYFLLGCNMG